MDITDIRMENIRKILNVLRFSSGMTKRDISAKTRLSFSSVSNVCNDLSDLGVLFEQKDSATAVGRTPDNYFFNASRYCSVCIAMQGETVFNFAVLNFANQLLYETELPIPMQGGIAAWANLFDREYRSLCEMEQFSSVIFVGIGISVPKTTELSAVYRGDVFEGSLHPAHLEKLVSDKTGLPCYVDSSANLCALSVNLENQESGCIIYLYSGIALEASAICDGRPVFGQHNRALELDHLPLGDQKAVCPICGRHGCIGGDLTQLGMAALNDLLSAKKCISLLKKYGDELGILIFYLVKFFDPDILYIGGPAMEHYDQLQPYMEARLRECLSDSAIISFEIRHDSNSLSTLQRGINQVIYEHWFPM